MRPHDAIAHDSKCGNQLMVLVLIRPKRAQVEVVSGTQVERENL